MAQPSNEESMEKVSYLIPSYNHAKYIIATLDSIMADEYPLKEIVLIDDGSNDHTEELVHQWIAEHPQADIYFRKRENKGITATLNELIRIASGKYLRLFSSDDLLVNGSTSILVSSLADNPRAYAIFSDVSVIDAAGNEVAPSALSFNGGNPQALKEAKTIKTEIISNWSVSGPAILIKKSWYEKFGYYQEDMRIDDWDLYLRLISQNALIYCDIVSARYRRHDLNTCRTPIIGERIKNLMSQRMAAERNIKSFSGPLKALLRAEHALINAKIEYLSRRYVACTVFLMVFLAFSVRGRM